MALPDPPAANHPLVQRLTGAFIAPVVPFGQRGIDRGALEALTAGIVQAGLAGCGGLVPASSTGEFMALSEPELDVVVQGTVAAANGRVPVIAGVNHMDTVAAIERARRAEANGANGVLLGPPFYFPPTRDEILRHFELVSSAIDIGIVLYDNAFATQRRLDPELLVRLSDLGNVVGIKVSTTDVVTLADIRRRIGSRLAILSAPAEWNEPGARLAGASGFVSVLGGLVPELVIALERLLAGGDYEEAAALAKRLMPLAAAVERAEGGTYIAALKAGLALRGLRVGEPRPPILPATAELRAELRRELTALAVAPWVTQ